MKPKPKMLNPGSRPPAFPLACPVCGGRVEDVQCDNIDDESGANTEHQSWEFHCIPCRVTGTVYITRPAGEYQSR